VLRQDLGAIDDHQGVRANGLHDEEVEEVRPRQDVGRWPGRSQAIQGSSLLKPTHHTQQPPLTRAPQEFYIPTESTSIHFLKSKLCVGCAKGFEVVDLQTLETQSLLDQADTSLDFVQRKENIKPIYIERIATEFLLCYTDFSFFVNRNGWRARPDWKIVWEGNPQAFAIFSPYILAFEPSFIEIRHMETGMLVHILTAKNIRMLHSSTRRVCFFFLAFTWMRVLQLGMEMC